MSGSMLVGLAMLIAAQAAEAPPGRLDREGCHTVRQRFVYATGTVLEPGTRHCHRTLGSIRLDGRERLEDVPAAPPRPVERGMSDTAGP